MGLGEYKGQDLCFEHTFDKPWHFVTSIDHNGAKISNTMCKNCPKTVADISSREKKMYICRFCGIVLCESCRDLKRCDYVDSWETAAESMNTRKRTSMMELCDHLRKHKKSKLISPAN